MYLFLEFNTNLKYLSDLCTVSTVHAIPNHATVVFYVHALHALVYIDYRD